MENVPTRDLPDTDPSGDQRFRSITLLSKYLIETRQHFGEINLDDPVIQKRSISEIKDARMMALYRPRREVSMDLKPYQSLLKGTLTGTIEQPEKINETSLTFEEAKYFPEFRMPALSGRSMVLATTTTCFLISYRELKLNLPSSQQYRTCIAIRMKNLSDSSESYSFLMWSTRRVLSRTADERYSVFEVETDFGMPNVTEKAMIPRTKAAAEVEKGLDMKSPNKKLYNLISLALPRLTDMCDATSKQSGILRDYKLIKFEDRCCYPEDNGWLDKRFRQIQDPYVTFGEIIRHMVFQEQTLTHRPPNLQWLDPRSENEGDGGIPAPQQDQ